jgi:hypothetical protein
VFNPVNVWQNLARQRLQEVGQYDLIARQPRSLVGVWPHLGSSA